VFAALLASMPLIWQLTACLVIASKKAIPAVKQGGLWVSQWVSGYV